MISQHYQLIFDIVLCVICVANQVEIRQIRGKIRRSLMRIALILTSKPDNELYGSY